MLTNHLQESSGGGDLIPAGPQPQEGHHNPVFASGNAELEQRLLRTFAALTLPRTGAEKSTSIAVGGSDLSAQAGLSKSSESELGGLSDQVNTDAAAEAVGENGRPAGDSAAENAARDVAAQDSTAQDAGVPTSCGGNQRGAASSPSAADAPASVAAPQNSESQQDSSLSSAAAAAGRPAALPAAANAISLSRGRSVARAESPGAWSEATDSTGCTDSSADAVRPPLFGSWVHYSLADVSEEAMSARGMQRACHLMLQQRRGAAAAAAATAAAAAAAANEDAGSGTNSGAAARTAAGAEEEPEDPRVRVGPRRRG